jgi:hypothetical protein
VEGLQTEDRVERSMRHRDAAADVSVERSDEVQYACLVLLTLSANYNCFNNRFY